MNDELGKCCLNHKYKLKAKCPPIFLWVGQIETSPGADYIEMIHYEQKKRRTAKLQFFWLFFVKVTLIK